MRRKRKRTRKSGGRKRWDRLLAAGAVGAGAITLYYDRANPADETRRMVKDYSKGLGLAAAAYLVVT